MSYLKIAMILPIDSRSSRTEFFCGASMSRKIFANVPNDVEVSVQPHAYNEYQQYFFPSVIRRKTFLDLKVFHMKYPNPLSQKNVAITLVCAIISILFFFKKE